MKKADLIKLISIALLMIVAYIPTFIWMKDRWTAVDTYYSHGFLVPFIAMFIVWLKRDKLSKLKIKPSKLGWALFIPGIAIHFVSALWRVYFSSGFSSIICECFCTRRFNSFSCLMSTSLGASVNRH